MKRSNIYMYLMAIVSFLCFYHFTNNLDIFSLFIIILISLIFISSLSHVSIYLSLDKYINKKCYYTKEKIFKLSILVTFLISLFYLLIIYFTALYLEKVILLSNLKLVFLILGISVINVPLLKLFSDYFKGHGFKKIGNNILNIYIFLSLIYLDISSIVLFYLKISNYLKVVIISCFSLFSGVIVLLICYLLLIKNSKKFKRNVSSTILEKDINCYLEIKKIFKKDIYLSLNKVINLSYLYFSLIISYKVFVNNYNYTYADASLILINTYFYSLLIILGCYYIYKKKNMVSFNNINKIISNKEYNKYFIISNFYIEKLAIYLPVSLIMLLFSKPLYVLLFNSYKYSYILGIMSIYFLFYLFYDLTIKIISCLKNYKKLFYLLVSSLVFFLIILIPLIDTAYRMGYPLIIGSIGALVISHLFFIVLGSIYLKKHKIVLINNIDKILNIFYKNIILAIILILLQIIIPSNVNNRLQALFLILFYFSSGIIAVVLINFVKKFLDARVDNKSKL